jgi:hypothetical protein
MRTRVQHRDVQPVHGADGIPVWPRGTTERVRAQVKAGGAHHVHVKHIAEVGHVRQDQVLRVRSAGLHGDGERHARHAGVPGAQQEVGAVLDPPRDVGVGRTAVGRVVLEAAVLRRVVRRRNDNAVREVLAAAAVVHQDRVRDDRCGGDTVVALDDGVHPVGREHLERRALGRCGERVGVLAQEERTVNTAFAPKVADGLGDGQDVRLGERTVARGAAVPAGAEGDPLAGIVGIGALVVVVPLEPGEVEGHWPRWPGMRGTSAVSMGCQWSTRGRR